MEFIALLLLAPLIWSSSEAPAVPPTSQTTSIVASAVASPDTRPRIDSVEGRWVVQPPRDQTLTMTVLDHSRTSNGSSRGPASVDGPEIRRAPRRIEVIVSAP